MLKNAFSLRRLNPFQGTLQVFTTPTARALSNNGLNWEIQVLSDRPQALWANTPFSEQQYYTFGIWSQPQGLRQVPLNPLFNTGGMLESTQQLLSQLEANLHRTPFPMTDQYELWLLDETSGQPVALLASTASYANMSASTVLRWTAAERGDFSFFSRHLQRKGLPGHDGHNPRVHASVLEALVCGRGGQNRRHAWFQRDDEGHVIWTDRNAEPLPAAAFPELPITLDWGERDDLALIMDYISWKAPQLLTLSNLSMTTREMIEKLAVKYADQIERYWRLYPRIHNKSLLNTARVEAKIRIAHKG